ncbi:MAG: amino acid ABC transporter substrate-binding protein, partial [Pseudomonas sp.]|nr:amino acid ABC transporter substrate-binding protein [Pseudomonas sp.]
MFKRLLLVLASASILLTGAAHAADNADTSLVLLTENFPPYNMAKNGKNFAQDENINGIAVDIVREMFKRAEI